MIKPTFTLPITKLCTVVWYRNGEKHEQLIDTPRSSNGLIDIMLLKHRVGFSEIRAVKSVDTKELLNSIGSHIGRR